MSQLYSRLYLHTKHYTILDILGVQPHEVVVITLIDKQVFPVITPVVDMIVFAKLKWSGFGHMEPLSRPEGFY